MEEEVPAVLPQSNFHELELGKDGRLWRPTAVVIEGRSLSDALEPQSASSQSRDFESDTVDAVDGEACLLYSTHPTVLTAEQPQGLSLSDTPQPTLHESKTSSAMPSLEHQDDIMLRLDEYMEEILRAKQTTPNASQQQSTRESLIESFTPPPSSPRLTHNASNPVLLQSTEPMSGLSTLAGTPIGIMMSPSSLTNAVPTPLSSTSLMNMTHTPLRRSSTSSSLPGAIPTPPFGFGTSTPPTMNMRPMQPMQRMLSTSASTDMLQYPVLHFGTVPTVAMDARHVMSGHQPLTRAFSSPLTGTGAYNVAGQSPLGPVLFQTQPMMVTSVVSSPLRLVQVPIGQPILTVPNVLNPTLIHAQPIHNPLATGGANPMHQPSFTLAHHAPVPPNMGVMSADHHPGAVSSLTPRMATVPFGTPTPTFAAAEHPSTWSTPSTDMDGDARAAGARAGVGRLGSSDSLLPVTMQGSQPQPQPLTSTPRRPSKLKKSRSRQKEKSSTPQQTRARANSFPTHPRPPVASAPTTPVSAFASMHLLSTPPSLEMPTMHMETPMRASVSLEGDDLALLSSQPILPPTAYSYPSSTCVSPSVEEGGAYPLQQHLLQQQQSASDIEQTPSVISQDISTEMSLESKCPSPSPDVVLDALSSPHSPESSKTEPITETMMESRDCIKKESDKQCARCGVTRTPQWRGNPGGDGFLCNRCGLRAREQDKDNQRRNARRREMYRLRKEKSRNEQNNT